MSDFSLWLRTWGRVRTRGLRSFGTGETNTENFVIYKDRHVLTLTLATETFAHLRMFGCSVIPLAFARPGNSPFLRPVALPLLPSLP